MKTQTHIIVLILFLQMGLLNRGVIADPTTQYQPAVKVSAATRIDWVYPLANQSPARPPAEWLRGYESTDQTYELFVPKVYDVANSHPLILFISPSDKAMGFRHFQQLCEESGMLFAGPHNAGNNCETPERVRIVLDALDDVRRNFNVDPDRTYIGGFSGGGRIACSIAFALPEYFGGVVPICAAGDLRGESWLRQRVIDRLSVAHLTGETDFNRGEVERFRGPMLADVGVRSRIWIAPKTGHSLPSIALLREAFAWLEDGLVKRNDLAQKYPASRADRGNDLTREESARRLFAEGKLHMQIPQTRYTGLMQLKGVYTRWPDLPEAETAKTVLLDNEKGDDQTWQLEDIAEQRRFLIARARALDAYASGPLPKQYETQRKSMIEAAIELWQLVINDGQDVKAVAEAKERIPKLETLNENK